MHLIFEWGRPAWEKTINPREEKKRGRKGETKRSGPRMGKKTLVPFRKGNQMRVMEEKVLAIKEETEGLVEEEFVCAKKSLLPRTGE